MDDQLDDAARERALPFITTEHFTLQTARSATIADSSTRASLFMSSVASSLVALAFVGQIAGLGSAFYAFAFILLPTLCFLGIVTFVRTLESTIEDIIYARGIGRIRRFYLEMVPQTREYFILAASDDGASTLGNMGLRPSRLRVFVTTAGMVSIITSVRPPRGIHRLGGPAPDRAVPRDRGRLRHSRLPHRGGDIRAGAADPAGVGRSTDFGKLPQH